jgi:hypothetical protein
MREPGKKELADKVKADIKGYLKSLPPDKVEKAISDIKAQWWRVQFKLIRGGLANK